jgi:chromate reductase, NAD(P)H dehydrogenase (quinone)
MTFHILAVSGSLRDGSCHTSLLFRAAQLAPEGISVSAPYPIAEVPFYNSDLDVPGSEPATVRAWRAAITAADAVLFASPEYNFGPTGVLKNAWDWAVRPMGAHVMVGKPYAVIGGGGKSGAAKSQEYFTTIGAMLGAVAVNEPVIAIAGIRDHVGPHGEVRDPVIDEALVARLNALRIVTNGSGQVSL